MIHRPCKAKKQQKFQQFQQQLYKRSRNLRWSGCLLLKDSIPSHLAIVHLLGCFTPHTALSSATYLSVCLYDLLTAHLQQNVLHSRANTLTVYTFRCDAHTRSIPYFTQHVPKPPARRPIVCALTLACSDMSGGAAATWGCTMPLGCAAAICG